MIPDIHDTGRTGHYGVLIYLFTFLKGDADAGCIIKTSDKTKQATRVETN